MYDRRLDKLAKVLVKYSVNVQKGDLVVITGGTCTEPGIAAVYREVLAAGGQPWVRIRSERCDEIHLRHASDEQLRHTSTFDKHIISRCQVYIAFLGDENTRRMSTVKPAKQALATKARKPILATLLKRASLPKKHPNRARWVGTQFPTNAHAQEAEMSLAEYADFVFHAGWLDERNPVASWKRLGTAQQRLVDFLNKGKEVHIRTGDGTDIRFGVRGRRWINCDGRANFPDGEVFTGPLEDATEGTVHFTYPAITGGREVTGIRLRFKAGKVVDASAAKNEAFLIEMLNQDRGARIPGELALGTNYAIKRFTHNTLFDEKIGGTFHLAVGASIPESGGKNKSSLHWDMVCDLRSGGVVTVDGKIISRNGRFTNAAWPR